MKRYFLLTLLLMLALRLPLQVAAQQPGVVFVDKAQGFSFTPGSVYSPTDLFPQFKQLLPGDTLTEIIPVTNAHDASLRLYLQLAPGEGDTDFLDALSLEILCDERLIFFGAAGAVQEAALLGTLGEKESTTLRVVLHAPPEMDNRYADTRGDLIWIFSAEEVPQDSLIQTGLLRWPVYALGIGGLLSVIFAIFLLRRKGHG